MCQHAASSKWCHILSNHRRMDEKSTSGFFHILSVGKAWYRVQELQEAISPGWTLVGCFWAQESVPLISSLWDPPLSCFYPHPVSKPFGPAEVKFKMRAIAFISSDVFKGVRNVMPFSVHEWQAKCQCPREGLVPLSYCEDDLTWADETQEKCCCPSGSVMTLLPVADLTIAFPRNATTGIFPSFTFTYNLHKMPSLS